MSFVCRRSRASLLHACSSAASDRAERTSKRFRPGGSTAGAADGACSTMTYALVPPTPSELTPARRGEIDRQGFRSLLTVNGVSPNGMAGFGRVKWRLGGSSAASIALMLLINDATPAAVSRCPMLVLIEPMAQNDERRV